MRCNILSRYCDLGMLRDIIISKLVCALWLVNLLYSPLNSKVCFSCHAKCQRYNKYLTNLVFSVHTVSYGSPFFPLGFMACVLHAWAIIPSGKNLVRTVWTENSVSKRYLCSGSLDPEAFDLGDCRLSPPNLEQILLTIQIWPHYIM